MTSEARRDSIGTCRGVGYRGFVCAFTMHRRHSPRRAHPSIPGTSSNAQHTTKILSHPHRKCKALLIRGARPAPPAIRHNLLVARRAGLVHGQDLADLALAAAQAQADEALPGADAAALQARAVDGRLPHLCRVGAAGRGDRVSAAGGGGRVRSGEGARGAGAVLRHGAGVVGGAGRGVSGVRWKFREAGGLREERVHVESLATAAKLVAVDKVVETEAGQLCSRL